MSMLQTRKTATSGMKRAGIGSLFDSRGIGTSAWAVTSLARIACWWYLAAVRQGLRRAPSHRYVVIETLPMTTGGRCVTVYDTGTGKFVSHGGYTVGGLPPAGSVVRLASFRAELVV
jgi:hypothetical protein